MEINEEKLHQFLGKMVTEMGAAATGTLVIAGDKLGLYSALAKHGPMTPEELAKKTGTNPRLVTEWSANQAASGYIEFDPQANTFSMSPEQQMIFSKPDSPFLMAGGYYSIASLYSDSEKICEAFRSDEGWSWGDHQSCLFCGVAKFFRPSYASHLVQDWLPALDGVVEKLKAGAKVVDVGCGFGHSTMIMAKAFPNSEFIGFDIHEPSVEHAMKHAKEEDLGNVKFEVATAQNFPGTDFDLATCFDCLHDMGDPAGASAHIKQALKADGSWLIVEPFANDDLAENMNPVGRIFYAFSTTICVPCAMSQEGGMSLGAQAGQKRIGEAVGKGGFTSFKRATETPFNLIFEARN